MDDRVTNVEELRAAFRRLQPDRHPFLGEMDRDVVYDNGRVMAPGGLYLAKLMLEELDCRPGDRVLDLGCGRGQTTRLIAEQEVSEVVGVDLWTKTSERVGCEDAASNQPENIKHIQADFRRGLPYAGGTFDKIFCMQSFHAIGVQSAMLKYTRRLLKTGGQICIAQTCFNREPDPLPKLFKDTDGWSAGYGSYHSPQWWAGHFERFGDFDVKLCEELIDGDIYWEDDVLYRGARANWNDEFLDKHAWLFDQIKYGHGNDFRLTHLILKADAI